MNYLKYINSDNWWKIRNARVEFDNFKCQHCGFKYELQVHHKTYDRLGDECLDDMVTLCPRCHNDEHIRLIEAKRGTPSEKEILRSILITQEEYQQRLARKA